MNFRVKVLGALVPVCLLLCFMSNTYSRYVADTTGNLKMSFAQWQILVNKEDITNSATSSVVLTPIIDENQYIETNKIAPSSTGYFDISIDPSNVDVSFNYAITLDVVNEDVPDLMITKYAILDSDYKEGSTITYNNVVDNIIRGSLDVEKITTSGDEIIASNSDEIIASNSDEIYVSNFKPFVVRIYFEWYEGNDEKMDDEEDSLIGNGAETSNLEINAQIKFEQKLSSGN